VILRGEKRKHAQLLADFQSLEVRHKHELHSLKGRLEEVTRELEESRDQRHQLSRSQATLTEANDALDQLLQRSKEESTWALQKVQEV
jgi:hypothetical protein